MTRAVIIILALMLAELGGSLSARANHPPSAWDLARCVAIAAPDARLSCYDTLAGRSHELEGTATPSVKTIAATTPAPAAAPPTDGQNFGLAPAQLHPVTTGPTAIEARIAKITESRTGCPVLVLDNGQTWTFNEVADDARLGPGDSVVIAKAALGSYLLKTASRRSYHVRRAQ